MKAKYNKTTISLAIPAILSEQTTTPDKRISAKTKKLSNFDIIAKQIYDSKGTFWDDEKSAINAIKKIKNLTQYKEVLKSLQKLTGGRGIGQYLKSFTTLVDRLEIVNHLRTFIPENQWSWTIEYIVPWQDFKYLNSSTFPGSKPKTAGQSNAATAMISYYSKKGLWKAGGPSLDAEFWKDYKHEIMLGAQIGTAIIPVVGPYISAGIGLADAKIYWDEGDRYSAGMMAILSIIPGLGGLAAKLGLTSAIKSLGKAGLTKFIAKLKLIANGGKPVLTQEEKKIIRILGQNQKPLIKQVEDFLKKKSASTAGKIGGSVAKQYAAIVAAEKAWDPIYIKAGLQLADIQDAAKPLLNKIKNTVINSKRPIPAIESISNTKLKQIIFEEYGKLLLEAASPFQTITDSNRFRNWMYINKSQQAKQMDVDPTGPKDSPQIIQAYNTFKNEYNPWLKASGYQPIEEIPQQGDGELGLSDVMTGVIFLMILKTIASGVLGFFGIRWAVKKFIAKKLQQKILGNPKQIQQVIKTAKDASPAEMAAMIKKLEPNAILSSADEEVIRKALNNPGLTTVMITTIRNQAIKDFIKHGGRTTGTFKAREIISLLTDAERAEFGEYILRYEKYMQFTEI